MWTTRSLKDRTRLVISFQCFWFFFLGGLNLVTVGSSFYMELAIDKKIVQILSCTYGVRFDWVFWTWHTTILNLVWMWVNSYIHPTQKCINKTVSFYIKHKCDCKSKKNCRVKWLIVLPFFLVCLHVWLSSGLDSCIVNGLDFDLCASLICVILLDLILLADTNFVVHKNHQNTQTTCWKSSMHRGCQQEKQIGENFPRWNIVGWRLIFFSSAIFVIFCMFHRC